MTDIYILNTTRIVANGSTAYKIVSTETAKSLKHVIVESKNEATLNVDLAAIDYESVEFVADSDLGVTTLKWLEDVPASQLTNVVSRPITCAESLKQQYKPVLEKLRSVGYNISLPQTIDWLRVDGPKTLTLKDTYGYAVTVSPAGVPYNLQWSTNKTIAGVDFLDLGEGFAVRVNDYVDDVFYLTCTDTISGKSDTIQIWLSVEDFKGLTFTAEEAGSTIVQNIGKANSTYWASVNGAPWQEYTLGTTITLTKKGDFVRWKGNGISNSGSTAIFAMTGKIAASGSVMSMIDQVGTRTYMTGNSFSRMFYNCSALTTAPELPATTLADYCYYSMFYGCSALTAAPELPATSLTQNCYAYMFFDCSALTTAHELPATTLADDCYDSMFDGCTSLTKAPEIRANVVANRCCSYMFYGCSAMTTAPSILPATTLEGTYRCYESMFQDCIALTTAPELPATTLAERCYDGMFRNCTSLTTAPELPATILVGDFWPEEGCYVSMFQGCSNLNYIKVGATSWNPNYVSGWVSGVSSTGTFVKPTSTSIPTGIDGIPEGWTVENI